MRPSSGSALRFLVLGPVVFANLVPIYMVFVNAFKTLRDIKADPLSLPLDRLTLANMASVVANEQLVSAFVNTMVYVVGSVTGAVVVGSMFAYVIARQRTRIFRLMYMLVLVGLLIPPVVTALPLVQILARLHLIGSMPALIIIAVGGSLPFTMFIYASFIHTIPVELDESAQIDGANRFTTFWRVIFPLLRPVTASVIIFLALGAFNDLLGPLLFLGASKDKAVLTTLLFANLGKYQSNYDQLFALIWLVMVPVIVFFVAMQRQFISGLTQGALK